MGLPEAFVARGPRAALEGMHDLLALQPAVLAALAEDPREPFARRLAAGTVLGLVGDPRIRPEQPQTVDVPGATVELGLDPARVASVVETWSHAGVIEPWIRKESPRYRVAIAPFRLMRYPVTNLEYRLFLEDTGLPLLPTGWRFGVYPGHAANHPVWTVTPEAAEQYAAWLSRLSGRRFRLPSEAEWEYAASGGDGREFPWGDAFGPERANTVEHGPLSTTPVGIHPAGRSPFGCDDMAGNVEEYTADDYRPYPGGDLIKDDLLGGTDTYRVARGGSFTRYGDLARCRRRHGRYSKPIYAMGFRLAEDH
jgi:formylglycine-generating enzyme required for sulfatase activity